MNDELSWAMPGQNICKFHLEHGIDVRREAQREVRVPVSESFQAPTTSVKKDVPKPVRTKKMYRSISIKLTDEISDEEVTAASIRMHEISDSLMAAVVGVVQGLTGADLGEFLGINEKNLSNRLGRVYRFLGFSNLPKLKGLDSRRKGDLLKQILIRVYNEFLAQK